MILCVPLFLRILWGSDKPVTWIDALRPCRCLIDYVKINASSERCIITTFIQTFRHTMNPAHITVPVRITEGTAMFSKIAFWQRFQSTRLHQQINILERHAKGNYQTCKRTRIICTHCHLPPLSYLLTCVNKATHCLSHQEALSFCDSTPCTRIFADISRRLNFDSHPFNPSILHKNSSSTLLFSSSTVKKQHKQHRQNASHRRQHPAYLHRHSLRRLLRIRRTLMVSRLPRCPPRTKRCIWRGF